WYDVEVLLYAKCIYLTRWNYEISLVDIKPVMSTKGRELPVLYNVLGLAADLPTFDNLGTVALSLAGRSRDTESREKVGESNCELLRHWGARHHSRPGRRPVSVIGHVARYAS